MPATPSAKEPDASASDRPIRAMLDVMGGQRNTLGEYVDHIPARRFGKTKARVLRKFVLLAIAANADPDGTSSHPSIHTLARRCLVTEQAIGKVLRWLKTHHLLHIESKGARTSKYGNTNKYKILFEEPPKKKRVKKHPKMKVSSAHKAPQTTGESTPNNSQEHSKQLNEAPQTTDGAPQNRSFYNRPDLPSEDRPSLPSSLPTSGATDRNSAPGADVNDDGDAEFTHTQKPRPDVSGSELSAKESFLAEQQQIVMDHLDNWKSTAAQRDESWQVAQKMGVAVYLAALTAWCDRYSEDDLIVSYEARYVDDLYSPSGLKKKETPVYGSWPLKMFLQSPNRTLVAVDVKPIVEHYGWHSSYELLFLLNVRNLDNIDEFPDLTTEQLETLRKTVSNPFQWGQFSDLWDWNGRSWESILRDPSAALARYYEERDAEQKRRAENLEKIRRKIVQQKAASVAPATRTPATVGTNATFGDNR